MIFSHEGTARWLIENFECAWEAVRKVPKIEIDFGDGKKLKRTLNGNIATYFCTTDGKVFDILPGLVDREEFVKRSKIALGLHGEIANVVNKRSAVSRYHGALKDLELAKREEFEKAVKRSNMSFDVSKMRVEDGLKKAVGKMIEKHADVRFKADKGKKKVEKSIMDLMEDTAYNRKNRYPKIHAILAAQPLVDPSMITKKIYKDVLDTDLDDPYLGLAPYVLGGEGGRIEGK